MQGTNVRSTSSPRAARISLSSIRTWAACPSLLAYGLADLFMCFVARGSRVGCKRSRTVGISPLDGQPVATDRSHRILELRAQRPRPMAPAPRPSHRSPRNMCSELPNPGACPSGSLHLALDPPGQRIDPMARAPRAAYRSPRPVGTLGPRHAPLPSGPRHLPAPSMELTETTPFSRQFLPTAKRAPFRPISQRVLRFCHLRLARLRH
jgi:hypothetical protein